MKISKKTLSVFLILLIVVAILLLNSKKENALGDRLSVATSFYPLYFLASEIAGQNSSVSYIIPQGVEPHEYEITAENAKSIEESDILIINGGGIETFEKYAREKANKLLTATELVATIKSVDGNSIDPHVWLSPKNSIIIAEKIKDSLIELDAENDTRYQENFDSLKARLESLDNLYTITLESCEKRDIVTNHSAFAYLANEYKLRQVPITGISPEEEPSAEKIANLIDLIKQQEIKTIFLETFSNSNFAETISKETGATLSNLNPLEGLTEQESQDGKNYITIMTENLSNLQEALSCIPAGKI